MASIRKTKKRLKRKTQKYKRLHDDVDESFHCTAVEFVAEWLSAGAEVRLDRINIIRKLNAFIRSRDRFIRKQGKWQEYAEFKKKRQQKNNATTFTIRFCSRT